ncbi:macro domain-containing protein [Corticibacter populi]|uniref:macro domain-containing protein n=1 Tax=Corticibacter populi TaxID=1550736 RepID=UPI0010E22856|nr:macro domain-containing protein [Corticibacter populi]RZS35015.1 O-acetyl-ADP-ribose deacetylase (regulator of RNase III) [Corticibacter populi]
MTIKEVSGDILLSQADLLAHGIAANDPFDSGLALALRERWPSLVKDYRHHTRSNAIEPGEIWVWAGINEGGGVRRIANLVTQDSIGQGPTAKPGKATLENVRHVLQNLARHVQQQGITSLALPRLATGVGGLTWDDVKPLIAQYLGGLDIPVVVYVTYQKGVAADEGLAN